MENKREKTGGRIKGTPNKTTAEAKQKLMNVVGIQLNKLGSTLNKLEPLERVNALAKLLPYILPKQQDVSIKADVHNLISTPEQREARYQELKKKLLANI
jgi:type III secretory pathway lipoprotein EscJ